MPSLEMRRISCATLCPISGSNDSRNLRLSLLPEMGQRARIFISEHNDLKCLATSWFASLPVLPSQFS